MVDHRHDTKGESVFSDVCEELGYEVAKISESQEKTPDFIVKGSFGSVFCEVKDIGRNETSAKIEDEGWVVGEINPNHSGGFFNKLKGALPQLRPLSQKGMPTVLVIYFSRIDPAFYFQIKNFFEAGEQSFDPSISGGILLSDFTDGATGKKTRLLIKNKNATNELPSGFFKEAR